MRTLGIAILFSAVAAAAELICYVERDNKLQAQTRDQAGLQPSVLPPTRPGEQSSSVRRLPSRFRMRATCC